jgi:GR25 family glycosyltransferase involved in LPS biosynthesis
MIGIILICIISVIIIGIMLWTKTNYTPFNTIWNESNKKKIHNMMINTTDILSNSDISAIAMYETLVGILRHGDIIPWSDNVEIMIDSDNYYKLLDLESEFNSRGLRLLKYNPLFKQKYIKICTIEDSNVKGNKYGWPFINILQYKIESDEVLIKDNKIKYSYVFPVQSNVWLGLDIPGDPNNILNIIYGKDWQTICTSSKYNNQINRYNNRNHSINCNHIQTNIDYTKLWNNVWVINLDRDTHRWKTTNERLNNIGITANRWKATDAKSDEIKTLYSTYLKKRPLWRLSKILKIMPNVLTINEFACYISHVELWKHLYSIGANNSIILEDDIVISPNIDKKSIENVIDSSNGFSIILLGYLTVKRLVPDKIYSSVGYSLLNHAYVINGDSLKKLIDNSKNIYYKFDWYTMYFCKENLCYISYNETNLTKDTFGNGIIHQDRDEHGSNLRTVKVKNFTS